jgi:putative ATP-dependent endonuclease of the OLD family
MATTVDAGVAPEAGTALGQARSAAKRAFQGETGEIFDEALKAVNEVASNFAVGVGTGVKALLDTHQVSIGTGAIALHNGEDVPLRSMGLGSSRLLVAGLQQRAASDADVALIDEIEHGLEPYRIARLLHVLGSKASNPIQIFLTTHSPVVLRELSSAQIVVLQSPTKPSQSHRAISVGKSEARQKTLRACAEALLTPGVLVCEG